MAETVHADPLSVGSVVAVQNTTQVDLFSNPGVTLLGPRITFFVDINGTLPPASTDTVGITGLLARRHRHRKKEAAALHNAAASK